jgi:type III restriction enzyme
MNGQYNDKLPRDLRGLTRPALGKFQIEYRSGEPYEPDFVVETEDRILICEIKAENEFADPVV